MLARVAVETSALGRRFVRLRRELAVALASVVLTLLAAEVALRAYYSVRTTRELSRMAETTAVSEIHTGIGALGPGVRFSNRPNVIYELRPNLRGTYDGRRFHSDRYGFREDREIALAKPPGVVRIVGIGDSWMWGSGVDNGETYLDRLSELLEVDGIRADVVNTGVWGYNALQQVATLRWKGLAFAPDVVVIGLCGNDREYPTFLGKNRFVDLSRSFLWNELGGHLGPGDATTTAPAPDKVESMPFAQFLGAYTELAELSKTHGFRVVVFSECFDVRDPSVEHPSCRLGTASEWKDFVARIRAFDFRVCPWNIGVIPQNHPHYGHATVEGNRMLAAVLADCVRPLLPPR